MRTEMGRKTRERCDRLGEMEDSDSRDASQSTNFVQSERASRRMRVTGQGQEVKKERSSFDFAWVSPEQK